MHFYYSYFVSQLFLCTFISFVFRRVPFVHGVDAEFLCNHDFDFLTGCISTAILAALEASDVQHLIAREQQSPL